MPSVGEQLRQERRRREMAMTPAARMELALRLGDDDAQLYAAAHGTSLEEARLLLARLRQRGRTFSPVAQR